MLQAIAKHRVGHRADRIEPRAVIRRPADKAEVLTNLEAMGTAAKDAVPRPNKFIADNSNKVIHAKAAAALGKIGKAAVRELTVALDDRNYLICKGRAGVEESQAGPALFNGAGAVQT